VPVVSGPKLRGKSVVFAESKRPEQGDQGPQERATQGIEEAVHILGGHHFGAFGGVKRDTRTL
jgi:hypothetical protein